MQQKYTNKINTLPPPLSHTHKPRWTKSRRSIYTQSNTLNTVNHRHHLFRPSSLVNFHLWQWCSLNISTQNLTLLTFPRVHCVFFVASTWMSLPAFLKDTLILKEAASVCRAQTSCMSSHRFLFTSLKKSVKCEWTCTAETTRMTKWWFKLYGAKTCLRLKAWMSST